MSVPLPPEPDGPLFRQGSRLLVTGSRRWTDETTMSAALAEARLELGPHTVLVHGACDGADRMAARLWEAMGLRTEAHPARWDDRTIGRGLAGFVRNTAMVMLGADLCLAFPTGRSRGTYDCIGKAREAGIPTRIFGMKPPNPKHANIIGSKREVVE